MKTETKELRQTVRELNLRNDYIRGNIETYGNTLWDELGIKEVKTW